MRRFAVGITIMLIAALALPNLRADDKSIAESIMKQLQQHKDAGKLKGFGLNLNVNEGTVWLKGHVASEHQQQLAIDAARHAKGVKRVVNEISVNTEEKTTQVKQPTSLLAGFRGALGNLVNRTTKPSNQPKAEVNKVVKQPSVNLQTAAADAKAPKSSRSNTVVRPATRPVIQAVASRGVTARTASHPVTKEVASTKPLAPKPIVKPATKTAIPKLTSKPALEPIARKETTAAPSKPAVITDQQIGTELMTRLKGLKDKGLLKGFTLDVNVDKGAAWLKGTVRTEEQHKLLVETARRVPGVKTVVNDLSVVGTKPIVAVSSSTPAAKPLVATQKPTDVKAPALAKKPETAQAITKTVRQPEIPSLAAPARNPIAIQSPKVATKPLAPIQTEPVKAAPAKAAPAKPATVEKVAAKPAVPSDQQLLDAIAGKLNQHRDSGKLKGYTLDLQSNDRVVTLDGTITSTEQEKLILDAVRWTPGVAKVVNGLKIVKAAEVSEPTQVAKAETPKQPVAKTEAPKAAPKEIAAPKAAAITDQQIAQAIGNKLKEASSKGQIQGTGIQINSTDGVVWLKGKVGNAEHLKRTLEIARYTKGVKTVVNDLTIAEAKPSQPERSDKVAAQPQPARQDLARTRVPRTPAAAPAPARDIDAELTAAFLRGRNEAMAEAKATEMKRTALSAARPAPSRFLNSAATPAATTPYASQPVRPASSLSPAPYQPPKAPAPRYAAADTIPLAIGAQPRVARAAAPYYGHRAPQERIPSIPARRTSHSGMAVLAAPLVAPLALGQAVGNMLQPASHQGPALNSTPAHMAGAHSGTQPARFDHPQMPGYAWPSYAAYPNYGAVTYPKQYSPSAWPYIGPFYPYPQVPMGWRKVSLEWDDGWWMLDFKDK